MKITPYAFDEKNPNEYKVALDMVVDLAYSVDLGVSDPDGDSDTIILMLVDEYNKPAAAIWRNDVNKYYNFNIAVADEYQGNGLSRTLLDAAFIDFENLKKDAPELAFNLYVINPHLRDMLFRRGLYVTEDLRDRPGEESVIMGGCDSMKPLFEIAMTKNSQQFLRTSEDASKLAGMGHDKFMIFVSTWSETITNEIVPDFPTEGVHHLIDNMLINELDKRFLWEQVNTASGELKPFPTKEADDPKVEIIPEIIPDSPNHKIVRRS